MPCLGKKLPYLTYDHLPYARTIALCYSATRLVLRLKVKYMYEYFTYQEVPTCRYSHLTKLLFYAYLYSALYQAVISIEFDPQMAISPGWAFSLGSCSETFGGDETEFA